MSKSTPRKRTTRATDATSRTGTRKRSGGAIPSGEDGGPQGGGVEEVAGAAGEPKATRLPPEPNEER